MKKNMDKLINKAGNYPKSAEVIGAEYVKDLFKELGELRDGKRRLDYCDKCGCILVLDKCQKTTCKVYRKNRYKINVNLFFRRLNKLFKGEKKL